MCAETADRLAARADLCCLLAGCYYQPEAAFIEQRLFDSMHEVAARARRLGEAFVADDPQTLLVDYTRLFLGPVDTLARPYGAVWLGDGMTLMRDSTMDVLRLYGEGGFEIDDEFRDLPDHVAAELEFLYRLLLRQAQARSSGDAAAFDEAAALQRRFLEAHLGKWVGDFTAALARGAKTRFYRELATLTQLIVGREVAGGADAQGHRRMADGAQSMPTSTSRPGAAQRERAMDKPTDPPVWRQTTGAPVSCLEKLKVLNDNYRELQQIAQDAFEDALLMDCDEAQVRLALHELIDSLHNPYAGRD